VKLNELVGRELQTSYVNKHRHWRQAVWGNYRDVILPTTVLRRLDAVLEPTKQAVLGMKESLDRANRQPALRS